MGKVNDVVQIRVVGIGNAGLSAMNRMIEADIQGIEFLAIASDKKVLAASKSATKIRLGNWVSTCTLGSSSEWLAERARKAVHEQRDEIRCLLADTKITIILCGLGGVTATGAAPAIADLARDICVHTIAVVCRPFSFEGASRDHIAEKGLKKLASRVDEIITIPNDKILQILGRDTSNFNLFELSDEMMCQTVRCIRSLVNCLYLKQLYQ